MKDTKTKWFKEGKFGLMITFGLYSLLGGQYKKTKSKILAEWIMNDLSIPVNKYETLAKEFNPTEFNADELVANAKYWGMKYVVFIVKHHDGFALYHSHVDKYNSYDASPCKRDLVKELHDACSKYNLKFCIYYSQAQDWHEKNAYYQGHDNTNIDFDDYLEKKCIPQIIELLTEYGTIDGFWFDTPMHMQLEQSKKLVSIVKEKQPKCIINGRIGNNLGDYFTCGDNNIPAMPLDFDWEVPATLNDNWGFNRFDNNWKSEQDILKLLIKINSRGGNYLLNVGPDGKGNIPQKSKDILEKVGKYVNKNSDAIFATRAVFGNPYELDFGEITAKDHKLFMHVIYKAKKNIRFKNLANHVTKVTLIEDGRDLHFSHMESDESINSVLTIELPEEYQTKINFCVCVEYEEKQPVFEDLKN